MPFHTKKKRQRLKRILVGGFKARQARSGVFRSELRQARIREAKTEAQQIAALERKRRVAIKRVKAVRRVALSRAGLGGGLTFKQALGFQPLPKGKEVLSERKKRKRRKPKITQTNKGFSVEFGGL